MVRYCSDIFSELLYPDDCLFFVRFYTGSFMDADIWYGKYQDLYFMDGLVIHFEYPNLSSTTGSTWTDALQGIVEWLEEYDFIPSAETAPQTTNDLTEDFVERCLPEYPTRYDVFRLGELQNFLDGHESPEFGLNRDEAAAERDRLQLRIYAEAITAFMKRQPAALPGNVSLCDYAEVLVDIAYEAGRRKFRPSDNSRDTAATLIAWGDEFSRQHGDANRMEKEYPDEIYRFTAAKLRSVPSKDDPNAEFDIAFLNRTALERHGYDVVTITDSDLQELAERMGDYYCESSKFSEDLRTACGDFGLKLRDTTNPK